MNYTTDFSKSKLTEILRKEGFDLAQNFEDTIPDEIYNDLHENGLELGPIRY